MNKWLPFLITVISLPTLITAQIPSGAIAVYELNNAANDASGNNHNGSLLSTAGTNNRFGTANRATAFTAGSSVGILPLSLVTAVNSNFTIGFWFRTTMVAPSSSQWYGGSSLVDAEVCGVTTDWGTAMIDGGRVCMGIGNPDITIKSTASNYNDGNWHFVTVTRNMTGGTVALYMEGVQVASSSGTTTGSLNAPNGVRLGSNPCVPTCVYTGGLDDIVFYNRVLSSTEITNLYNHLNAFVLPLRWVSFSGELRGNEIILNWQVEAAENNERFEVEHSTDGIHFTVKATVPDGQRTQNSAGQTSYRFADPKPKMGNHFYRVRQVDVDGKHTWSKMIQIKVGGQTKGLHLQANPARDQLVLENGENIKVVRLQVTDVSGRIVLDRSLQSTGTIAIRGISQLKPGYYFLKITSASGNKTISWIKE